jgi:Ser/Thr protein kinase RdoA (MazF antagonist)
MEKEFREVLKAYPPECQPEKVESLGTAGGFSGARFWRLHAPRGLLCLRRWPSEHPTVERLEFIQAVLWHVDQQGFDLAPLALPAGSRKGYVRHGGTLWELTPWLAGKADFQARPNPARLAAALRTLAAFHQATVGFPLPVAERDFSPGIKQRLGQLQAYLTGGLAKLQAQITPALWPELAQTGLEILGRFPRVAPAVASLLEQASREAVPLSPCIRDIWHDHVLFLGDEVSGLVDFGALNVENVAADVARLLGSLVGDDRAGWEVGLAAYQSVRPLSSSELALMRAFDESSVLMSGLMWLEWVFQAGRVFEDRPRVLERVQSIAARMAHRAA